MACKLAVGNVIASLAEGIALPTKSLPILQLTAINQRFSRNVP